MHAQLSVTRSKMQTLARSHIPTPAPAPLHADCVEIHETIGTLVATLGYPIFVPLIPRSTGGLMVEAEERFYCTASGANGVGSYTEEGFVVLAGTTGRGEVVPSMKGGALERSREKLLDAGVAKTDGATFVFLKDHLFGSPAFIFPLDPAV